MTLTVLLVEDDRALRATLRESLALEGYHVLAAASLADARAQFAQPAQRDAIDVVLLDLGLPDGSGESFLAELRAVRPIPVIVISAHHTDDPKVRLLDAGADDYLVKPFSLPELFARVRAALRRRGTRVEPALMHYEGEGLVVDLKGHSVRLHGRSVHLTPTEFNLLARLVRHAGQVVTHRQLLADVWGAEFVEHTHYLRLYMGQLRAKLEEEPAQPRRLLTETGVGYRLVEPGG
jgi:two-component system KDP operon response regulator KdpE